MNILAPKWCVFRVGSFLLGQKWNVFIYSLNLVLRQDQLRTALRHFCIKCSDCFFFSVASKTFLCLPTPDSTYLWIFKCCMFVLSVTKIIIYWQKLKSIDWTVFWLCFFKLLFILSFASPHLLDTSKLFPSCLLDRRYCLNSIVMHLIPFKPGIFQRRLLWKAFRHFFGGVPGPASIW